MYSLHTYRLKCMGHIGASACHELGDKLAANAPSETLWREQYTCVFDFVSKSRENAQYDETTAKIYEVANQKWPQQPISNGKEKETNVIINIFDTLSNTRITTAKQYILKYPKMFSLFMLSQTKYNKQIRKKQNKWSMALHTYGSFRNSGCHMT